MKKPWLTQRRLLSAVAFVLFAASFLPTDWGQSLAAVPHWLVSAALAPPGAVITSVSHRLRPGPSHQIAEQLTNEQLHLQFGQAMQYVHQLEVKVQQLEAENARLKQSRQRINLEHVQLLDVRVTEFSGSRSNPVITIDHGKRAGIGKRMAVVNGFSLVGTVIAVGALTAEVRLITTPNTGLSVRIVPPTTQTPPRELDTWVQYKTADHAFRFDPAIDKPVKVGDVAYLDDDRWPADAQGFLVGKVTRIMRHPTNPLNLKRVIIQPVVTLRDLSQVTVLVPKD